MGVAAPSRYERKRKKAKTPSPSVGKKRGKHPSSSCNGTMPGGSTTTFGSSVTARLPAGQFRRVFRSSPGSASSRRPRRGSPARLCRFEGRSRPGEYGAGTVEIWDDGTYELVEEKPDGGLTVRLRRQAARRAVDARSGAARRRSEELAPSPEADDRGEKASAARRYEPMLATLANEVPHGPGWLYEVKWDGYRAIARSPAAR